MVAGLEVLVRVLNAPPVFTISVGRGGRLGSVGVRRCAVVCVMSLSDKLLFVL